MSTTIIKLVIQLIGLATVLLKRKKSSNTISPTSQGTIFPEDAENIKPITVIKKESDVEVIKYPTSDSTIELMEYIENVTITRKIKYIVFHCTGTSYDVTINNIINYWKTALGWKNPGYHIIISPDGSWTSMLDFNLIANGVKGINHKSIHISTIGGLNKNYPLTTGQENTLFYIYSAFSIKLPKVLFKGHNDFTDLKKCPGYSVENLIEEFEQ